MDYAEGIIEYFVDLRGKGATVSALDQQAVLEWERADVPLAAVLDGIDDAFARKAEPPKSIRDCKRWVTKQAKMHATRAGVGATAAPDAGSAIVARAIDAGGWDPSTVDHTLSTPLDVARRWLAALDAAEDARLHGAARALRAEVDAVVAEDGALPAAMLPVLEDALATLLLGALDADLAARARVAAATAANRGRDAGHAPDVVEQHRRAALRRAVHASVPWPALAAV